MRVLIADDDADLRDLVTIAVEKAGSEVAAAVASGTEAWAALQAMHVDLAVLDISMPGMTGLEVLQKVRDDGGLRELTVLVITADGAPDIAEQVHAAGADGLITKPFPVRELVRFIRDVAERL
ncbi:response regulator [Herbiconiux sp.]|uniref:response regulator n=1 Tax=Herbiconiux sp. TaxID=1871186 RepID=UPI0025BE56F7|nr:response regulator [Herbiconiux sp.]